MNRFPLEFTRALAVDPASRGLGYALLEGPLALINWGFRNARKDRNARCIAYVDWMLTKFKPDVLVLEDFGTLKSHRPARIKALADSFAAAAEQHGIACCRISRRTIRSRFPSCRTKYDIARELAVCFPEIKPWCPPTRKIWLTEDPRINIFDALSLAVTHLTPAKRHGSARTKALKPKDSGAKQR
jgi:Holliday junction resolvasome RuvABC endonuclease subunit